MEIALHQRQELIKLLKFKAIPIGLIKQVMLELTTVIIVKQMILVVRMVVTVKKVNGVGKMVVTVIGIINRQLDFIDINNNNNLTISTYS